MRKRAAGTSPRSMFWNVYPGKTWALHRRDEHPCFWLQLHERIPIRRHLARVTACMLLPEETSGKVVRRPSPSSRRLSFSSPSRRIHRIASHHISFCSSFSLVDSSVCFALLARPKQTSRLAESSSVSRPVCGHWAPVRRVCSAAALPSFSSLCWFCGQAVSGLRWMLLPTHRSTDTVLKNTPLALQFLYALLAAPVGSLQYSVHV
jgi:hypothetical protein